MFNFKINSGFNDPCIFLAFGIAFEVPASAKAITRDKTNVPIQRGLKCGLIVFISLLRLLGMISPRRSVALLVQ